MLEHPKRYKGKVTLTPKRSYRPLAGGRDIWAVRFHTGGLVHTPRHTGMVAPTQRNGALAKSWIGSIFFTRRWMLPETSQEPVLAASVGPRDRDPAVFIQCPVALAMKSLGVPDTIPVQEETCATSILLVQAHGLSVAQTRTDMSILTYLVAQWLQS